MKTKIEIEIDSAYAPSLYSILNKERKAAQDLLIDERFTKYPNLTAHARLTERNLDAILDKLGEEI